ncbi:putative dehydrogenase [Bradyrhizobium sp. LB1.3]
MKPNIALIGCGAIAQNFYLPSLARRRDEFGDIWLVDPGNKATKAASSAIAGRPVSDLSDVSGEVALAIIAVPNQLHCSLAQAAIARGAHVLIEKPFAIWPEEASSLVDCAATAKRVVAVNQTRRFMPLVRDLRTRVASGEFGTFRSATHYEGQKLSWPFESGAAFAPTAQRTGVIMDLGAHVIDFYHYLFEPEWIVISAHHDGFYGPEGLAEIDLQAGDAPIAIRLSRYQKQENVARLVFDEVEVHINLEGLNSYAVKERSGSVRIVSGHPIVTSYEDLADNVLENFIAASKGAIDPTSSGAGSMSVIRVLDQIYHSASLYPTNIGAI